MTATKEKTSCKNGGGCKCKSGFYKVHCDNCGLFLCEAPASTWTRCGVCRRWSRIEPGDELKND